MNVIEQIKKITQNIDEESIWRYSYEPIPCALDNEIATLVKLYSKAPGPEKEIFYTLIGAVYPSTLISFAERMASLAVTEKSSERIMQGLIALLIENNQNGDSREGIIRLAPLYHAASAIGCNSEDLFREAATFANNNASYQIVQFAEMPRGNKSLNAWNYEQLDSPEGVKYRFKGVMG
ncbi:MAG: hypothetical protein IPM66_04930 [Acidobacteriota bacterium]|nr:MAG: hypothetical protein IPM66_04930 [Acidobacteriota bacterium]